MLDLAGTRSRTVPQVRTIYKKIEKKIMIIIILYIFGLLILTLIIGRIYLSIQFSKEVKELFVQSKNISDKSFQLNQLTDLPEPVQRYFKHVLKEGQPYISQVRMTHDGQFKTGVDKDWISIAGEEYFTTQKPGFIWKGTTAMFTARDMYIKDKGRLVVTLFSVIKIIDGKGEHYDQGELLRWLGESVLYPTNLLPGERLKWSGIDPQTAKLNFEYKEHSLFFSVTFNEAGEIIQLETKRYMDEKNLETWIIKIAGYKEMNNVIVPTSFEVMWRLKTGDFSYAKFNVKKLEYNYPEKV
jgi:Family of unknown function (DUF6544)